MNALVSIIITTKNEQETIENLLESIKLQTYKKYEVIVVDNKSTDKTKTITLKYTNNFYEIGPERSAQRNYGLKKAKGEIVIFLDADMQLTSNVLEACVNSFKNPNIQSIVIPEKSIGTGYWSKCKIYERDCYLGVKWIESARCFRKSTILNIGGFDESMSGPEDFDLPQRVEDEFGEESVFRINQFIIHNEGKINILNQLSKKYYYGLSLSRYLKKSQNRQKAVKQGNLLRRYFLFIANPKKVLININLLPGVFILKTAEIICLSFGLFNNKIKGGK